MSDERAVVQEMAAIARRALDRAAETTQQAEQLWSSIADVLRELATAVEADDLSTARHIAGRVLVTLGAGKGLQ